MEKKDIEELRDRVACAAALEQAGFAIDLKQSTRRAQKYRRGDEIIIVLHEGKGWFDPLSDARGDIFSLVEHLDGVGFAEALECVRGLMGYVPSEPAWKCQARNRTSDISIPERWGVRRKPWRGSPTWRYLRDKRCIPGEVIRAAIQQDVLREGPRGSMWAAHADASGAVRGWEERGSEWRGFATGGAKLLFRFGPPDAQRVCITEAAIDAMSLAALENLRPDSLYLSTGGGWAPATEAAIRALAAAPGALLVAATDNNRQGDVFADRLRTIAAEMCCDFQRLRPRSDDWNEDLKMKEEEKTGEVREIKEKKLPHARRPRQGRLRPLCGP